MVPTVDSTTNKSEEVKEVIKGTKNCKAAGTEQLQLQSFKYSANGFENLKKRRLLTALI